MARDQADVVIQQTFPDAFAALCATVGAPPDQLSDQEFHAVANETLRQNLGPVYAQAMQQEGVSIDATVWPAWAQKLAAIGATHESAREFARAVYPELDLSDALRRLQRDVARAANPEAKVEKTASPLFDRAF